MKNLTFFIRRSCSVGGILILLLTAGLTSSRAQDTWTQKANGGGGNRDYAVGFNIGDKGYIGTGYNNNGTLKDFWEYNPETNTWTQKADFGGGWRARAVGFSIGSKGYLGLGSWSGFTNDWWEYDPAANTWTQKANFAGGAPEGAVGFSIGDKGYVGLGWDNNDFWEYDPVVDTWTRKADFGGGVRYYAVGFSISNKGYIGTGTYHDNLFYRDFWEYDPLNNTWIQKADFGGDARATAVGFSIGSKGYIGTGQLTYQNYYYKDFWEYDPSINTWIQKADFGGEARATAVGFSIGSKGYLGTGYFGDNPKPCKDFWEYDPGTEPSCTVPLGETTVNITGTSAKLQWDLVADALRYKVRYKEAGTSEWSKITDVKSNSKNISGLIPNAFYYWDVKSVCSPNPIDASDWSAKASFTTGEFKMGDEPIVSLELYPNPVSESFTLDLKLGTTTDVYFFSMPFCRPHHS